MRQGIVIFADARATDADAAALREAADAAAATGATPFVAYAPAVNTQALRAVLGGPPPRFFPQATRQTLGERMAQAFAFMFVQGVERALLIAGALPVAPQAIVCALEALDAEPVHLASDGTALLVALRRADFPRVAAIFDDVAWERPEAVAEAGRLLAELAAEAQST